VACERLKPTYSAFITYFAHVCDVCCLCMLCEVCAFYYSPVFEVVWDVMMCLCGSISRRFERSYYIYLQIPTVHTIQLPNNITRLYKLINLSSDRSIYIVNRERFVAELLME